MYVERGNPAKKQIFFEGLWARKAQNRKAKDLTKGSHEGGSKKTEH